ncbi:MAG TPA: septum formation initiator family protein [Candidatus Agathobaculum merdigallinarum]|mgnify:CR=1 FL=1|nr:septum formation initiator family protein [Candidatus Agathobaculum merdigallinarum]
MMTPSRESVAYQEYEERFPVQQERERNLRVAPAPRRRRKAGIRPSLLACIAILAVTSAYILFCQMQLTQITAQVSEQSDKLDELAAENVSLTTKKVNSMNLDEVEEYAANELGMVKIDNSQIEYVELTNPDSVTVADSGISLDTLFAGLARSFSAIVEYIR